MRKDLSSSDADGLFSPKSQEELDNEERLLFKEIQSHEHAIKELKKGLPSYLPNLDGSIEKDTELMNLRDSDDYVDTDYVDMESFMFNPELTKEYERIKDSYKDLIDMFQNSIEQNTYSSDKSQKVKDNRFANLEEFDNAVSTGDVSLNKYTIKEINELMQELTRLEEKVYNRDLEDYELKTVGDFHRAVDKGILNINKYDIKDINKLLDSLEDDEKLDISDYNISLFGNISIGEIHIKVEHGIRDYSKLNKLKSLPSTDLYEELAGASKQRMVRKPQMIEPELEEEIYTDLGYEMEKGFIEKIKNLVKKIFKRKKDP